MLCIIDIETNKGRNFTADDFAGVVILLMTGITAETLGDAVNLARIAEKSGIVTIGIPSHNIPPESEDFQEFRKYADAVIFSRCETEGVLRRTFERISDTDNEPDLMKLDIQGFFMSMDKHVLYHRIMTFLYERYEGNDLDLLEYMLRKTIYNRPEKNCFRKMPPKCWEGLPANKSLFGTDGLHGLPIGNLTSQLLALLYLDPLDHLITEDWGIVHYGRYVDDMVLAHPSKERLLEVRGLISEWLQTQGLTLHPKKTYLQHCAKGVRFVGSVIKPGRKYISSRTMGNFHRKLFHQNKLVESGRLLTDDEVRKFVAVVNSYMGMMLHFQSGRHFRRFLNRLSPLWYKYVYICKRDRKVKLIARKKIKENIELI